LRRAAVLLLGAALAACGPAQDPVEILLAELEAAAEDRDPARFASHLSPSFTGQGNLRRSDAEAALRRALAGYETVELDVFDVEREPREGGRVHVRLRVEMTGRAQQAFGLQGLLPPDALYRFELELVPEDGVLKVTSAAWELESRPAGSG
jgi:hypothetical protein